LAMRGRCTKDATMNRVGQSPNDKGFICTDESLVVLMPDWEGVLYCERSLLVAPVASKRPTFAMPLGAWPLRRPATMAASSSYGAAAKVMNWLVLNQ
jgi:hypothetical protein